MTVKELIKKLKKFDGDKDIFIAFDEGDGDDFEIEEGDYSIFLVSTEY